MIFSYHWLQSFFSKKLPKPEKLAEVLTMHSFETTCQYQNNLSNFFEKKGKREVLLDIDVLPNRGSDCFSHLGIAREISAVLNFPLNFSWEKSISFKEDPQLKTKDFIEVKVKSREDCLRYTGRIIFNIKVKPSPRWLREKLIACGLRPINNIVDIANYVMLEIGQPLHAFDFEKIEENKKGKKEIIVRRAKKGEKIVTLDGEEYELDENILIIADPKEPLAIAGIKGGKKAEIDEKTKTVILESANFSPTVIRQGSRHIDLKTDASWRFEHGLDPNLTELAINRAVSLIQKVAGGKIAQGLVDFYPQKIFPKKIILNLNEVEELLGAKISEKKVKDIFQRLEFKISKPAFASKSFQEKILEVEIPTFRQDLNLPEDLIEEIGRIYGFEKIPPNFPFASLIPPKRNFEVFWEGMAKDILKETGLVEVYNYSFIGEKEKNLFRFKEIIELENPTSADFKYLRPSLLPNLLKNILKNQRFFQQIKIFELGKIFRESKDKTKIEEKKMLSGAITGEAFFEVKGVVDFLFQRLGIPGVWYDQFQPTPEDTEVSLWHPTRCAEIKVDHQEIGFLGEISPNILESLKIKGKVVAFDIDFEKLSRLASEETVYQPISPYPAVIRDISILLPRKVLVEEVLNEIERNGGRLIADVDLFDIYEGEELPEGTKNLSFHIVYQDQDRPLSSEEVNEVHEKIIKAIEEKGWEVRK